MFLSFLEKPILGIVHDLETPVEEVERVFGVVIKVVKDIIQSLIDLLNQVRNLFNEQEFDSLFVEPFKAGFMMAVSGLRSVVDVILKEGRVAFADMEPSVHDILKDAFYLAKKGVSDVRDLYHKVAEEIENVSTKVIDDGMRDVYSLVGDIENGVDLIASQVDGMLRVSGTDVTEIAQEFVGYGEAEASNFVSSVNRVGQIAFDDVKEFEQSMANRMRNENEAIDLLMIFIIGSVIMVVVGLVFYTRSKSLAISVVVVMLLTFASYAIW